MTPLRKKLKAVMESAIADFRMIRPGDRIAVAVSGGPDSLALLNLLSDGFGFVTSDYSLLAVHIDMGFAQAEPVNRDILETHFRSMRVEYRIEKTDIADELFSGRLKKNPCFVCSMLRRKRLYETADREGCNKIATGHHRDDIIDTLLLNVLYGRKIGTLYPVQPLFRNRLTLIRPFVYIEEARIKRFAGECGLPALRRLCPLDGSSRRAAVKGLIRRLQKTEKHADLRNNIFKSLYHVELKSFQALVEGQDFT
ncbi:tRNA 2-thiocytidine(32) synthetase TtcA [bacterium]|nr:tRNA 2-thiocytidine(32) synthetase TtcA [bacterium]